MKNYLWWLVKVLTLFVIIVVIPVFVLIAVISAGFSMAHLQSEIAPESKNVVAVVELTGEISTSKEVVDALYKQIENPKVQGIVLRVDSPGGAVAPSQDIYNTVKKLKAKKPIVVSMGQLAASGGLYSSMSASKVFCQPGTLTGSIGVIMQMPNVTAITDKFGFKMITLTSGQFKDAGNMYRDMTPADKELLQNTIMGIREQFVQDVVAGRGLKREEVEKFADGRVLIGSEAKKLGLVDEFGDVYDAARAVFDLLNQPLPEGEYPTLYYPDENIKKFKKIIGSVFVAPIKSLLDESQRTEVKLLYR